MTRRRLTTMLEREDGVTLLELLITLVLVGTLIAVFSSLLATTVRHSNQVQQQSLLQNEVRSAIDRMAQDLRQLYVADTTVQPVETATATELTFLSPDRVTPYHIRRVSYRLNAGQLERRIALTTNTGGPPWTYGSFGPWHKVVGRFVNANPFTYLDVYRNPTTTASSVRIVKITLTTAAPGGGRAYTYESSVTLRTL